MLKPALLIALIIGGSFFAAAQDERLKVRLYNQVVDAMLEHSVPEVRPEEVSQDSAMLFLDARERDEFEVSRIRGARYVGYLDFDLQRLEGTDRSTPIIVYCSVGYRSEKIAKRLIDNGFSNVYNLVGGIFGWSNAQRQIVDKDGAHTNEVHGFDRLWGKWLIHADVVYDDK